MQHMPAAATGQQLQQLQHQHMELSKSRCEAASGVVLLILHVEACRRLPTAPLRNQATGSEVFKYIVVISFCMFDSG